MFSTLPLLVICFYLSTLLLCDLPFLFYVCSLLLVWCWSLACLLHLPFVLPFELRLSASSTARYASVVVSFCLSYSVFLLSLIPAPPFNDT